VAIQPRPGSGPPGGCAGSDHGPRPDRARLQQHRVPAPARAVRARGRGHAPHRPARGPRARQPWKRERAGRLLPPVLPAGYRQVARQARLSAPAQANRPYTSSSAMAVASPPPMHRLATPRLPPRASRAASRVATIRAPLAPIGWPRAQAPPLTFSFSRGIASSLSAIIATTAKASLISKRSTSSTDQPARFSAFCTAGTGAVVKSAGSWAWAPCPTTRATTFRPSFSATEARVITRAAAPSLIEEALAAVIAPSLAKAGFRLGIFAGSAFRGCSSALTVSTPLRPATSTGTI